MNASRVNTRLIAALILCGLLVFLIDRFTGFEPRWRGLKDGMTQLEVRQALGPPDWTGPSGIIGSGSKEVVRWEYHRSGLWHTVHYYVYFDYADPTGKVGAPVVFKIDRVSNGWDWWPWKVKARA